MERKRIEKIVALLLLGILIPVSLFPFPVYADTIDTHIRGRNYTYEPITYNEVQVSTNTYYENIGVIHITFELDDEYIGYVLPNYTIQYDNYFYGASTPNWGTLSKTFDRRIFINGSSFSFDIPVNWNSISINTAPGGDPFNYDSYTITSSDVIKYADIDSLDQIINILQDNQDIITDIESELQTVVSNTSLANTYLESLTKLRQYHYPIESFVVNYFLFNKNYDIATSFRVNYWDYPVFIINANGDIYQRYLGIDQEYLYKCILPYNINNNSSLNNYFGVTDGFTLTIYDSKLLNSSPVLREITINIKNTGNEAKDFVLSAKSRFYQFIAIYAISKNDISGRYSTDFALNFGLSNQLLDDLHIIANGTTQSSSASGSLDQTTSQFSDDANDLVTIEESFNNSMNESLQNVNPTFNMGSSFLTSANWVSQQFNRIVNNTPFASLITFGLTLGLGLLIIGKVRK